MAYSILALSLPHVWYAILCVLIGTASILWTEIFRDIYHYLGHIYPPLSRLHAIHHRVFRRDLTVASDEMYRLSQWKNDVPEAFVMFISSLIFLIFLYVYFR